MSILYLLIPVAVLLIAGAIAFFVWSVRTGQFEDLEGPAHRILMDDDDPLIPSDARPPKRDATPRQDQEGKGE
jgi:cbb3-type cytochrome oxidase maturation protein